MPTSPANLSPGTLSSGTIQLLLESQSFELLAQEVRGRHNGEPLSFELLWRPRHPVTAEPLDPGTTANLLSPDQSIELAALSLAMVPSDVPVSVNLHADAFTPYAVERLAECHDRLTIEITESRPLHPSATSARGLAERLGVIIALDDAGSELCGTERIDAIRPDVVKLDRNVLLDLRTGLLLSTHARRVGATLVSEGIESRQHLLIADILGADAVQGWAIALPLPVSELAPRPNGPGCHTA